MRLLLGGVAPVVDAWRDDQLRQGAAGEAGVRVAHRRLRRDDRDVGGAHTLIKAQDTERQVDHHARGDDVDPGACQPAHRSRAVMNGVEAPEAEVAVEQAVRPT